MTASEFKDAILRRHRTPEVDAILDNVDAALVNAMNNGEFSADVSLSLPYRTTTSDDEWQVIQILIAQGFSVCKLDSYTIRVGIQ